MDYAGSEMVVEGFTESFQEVAITGYLLALDKQDGTHKNPLDFSISLFSGEVGVEQIKFIHTDTPHKADPTPCKRHKFFPLHISWRGQLRHTLVYYRPYKLLSNRRERRIALVQQRQIPIFPCLALNLPPHARTREAILFMPTPLLNLSHQLPKHRSINPKLRIQ